VLAHPLADGLEGLESGPMVGGMHPDALGVVVIDGDEDRRLTFARSGRRHIGAPHRVDRFGDDRAVMVTRASGRSRSCRRQQRVLAHQPQHPVA